MLALNVGLVVVVAVLAGLLYPPSAVNIAEDANLVATARRIAQGMGPEATTRIVADAPPEAYDPSTRQYNFGRYTRPVKNVNLAPLSKWDTLTTDKAFVWVGLTTGNITVSLAMLQFNYAAAAVFAVFDATTGHSWSQYMDLPAALALLGPEFVPDQAGHIGVASGCVRRRDWGGTGSICYDEATSEVVVDTTSVLTHDATTANPTPPPGKESLRVSLTYRVDLGRGYFPTMVFPLGVQRAVTVSKYAARPVASGELRLGDATAPINLKGALASTDYTRGQLRRETIWKWLSLSTQLPEGQGTSSYGLHLSVGTYDFGFNNASSESSIFTVVEDIPAFAFYDTGGVKMEPLDASQPKNKVAWRITGHDLDLTFTPQGGKFHGDMHLGVIDADLWHLWGTFSGTAPLRLPRGSVRDRAGMRVTLDNVPGVFEDHYSLW